MVESFVATETQMDVKVELGGNFWFLLSVLYTLPLITPGEMELLFTKHVFPKPVLSNFGWHLRPLGSTNAVRPSEVN